MEKVLKKENNKKSVIRNKSFVMYDNKLNDFVDALGKFNGIGKKEQLSKIKEWDNHVKKLKKLVTTSARGGSVVAQTGSRRVLLLIK